MVDMPDEAGKPVTAPTDEPRMTFEHLLNTVTEDNLHDEVETGPATGKEEW
jgi:hypothetical protein